MLRSIGWQELLIVSVPVGLAVAATIPFCKISERLGFSKWWGLLNLCPFGTIVWAYYVGFSKWPSVSSPR